ncbi:hypothetical protein [Candidatus Puniceispirillum sp.]|jgi:hypothetical protein|uniref:hypothetical protein n=1 Tax=Candidatus Puniceispirillum sp. TaxID=2026719 RepID=UPI001ED7132C|nr:hypothetical protein [Oceanospirillaceae bacterium]MBT6415766.1 hypothetical protein [Candidatus Puniceispirillum sp.]MBT6566797.1 hypothetical protein [Candidatus Puniceispirillum sp.]
MSLNNKLVQSMSNRNVGDYLDLLHEDFVATFHKSGDTFSKSEWAPMVTGMMENEKFIQESSRCVYENDDILVMHTFMSYPDDSREAVMLVAMLKDGKIISMETGATALD